MVLAVSLQGKAVRVSWLHLCLLLYFYSSPIGKTCFLRNNGEYKKSALPTHDGFIVVGGETEINQGNYADT